LTKFKAYGIMGSSELEILDFHLKLAKIKKTLVLAIRSHDKHGGFSMVVSGF